MSKKKAKWAKILYTANPLSDGDAYAPEGLPDYLLQQENGSIYNLGKYLTNYAIVDKGQKASDFMIIAFDGKKLTISNTTLAKHFLDDKEYDIDFFSHEDNGHSQNGRPAHFINGLVSNSKDLPKEIPVLTEDYVKKQYEEKVVPVWRKGLGKEIFTKFESKPDDVTFSPTSEFLDKKTCDNLQNAMHKGKPYGVLVNLYSKENYPIQGFEKLMGTASPAQYYKKHPHHLIDLSKTPVKESKQSNTVALAVLAGGGAAAIAGLINLKKKSDTQEADKEKEKKGFSTAGLLLTGIGVLATGWAVYTLMGNKSQSRPKLR